jgi:RNA polymerase sigma factor (sigma-70 family)
MGNGLRLSWRFPDVGLDAAAVEQLVNENLSWAWRIAENASRKLPPSFDIDDLRQAAAIGVWTAAQKFDPSRGVPFQGYAAVYVKGAVAMSTRRRHWTAATCDGLEDQPILVDPRPSVEQELLGREEKRNRSGRRYRHRREWLRGCIASAPPADAYLLTRVYLQDVDLRELSRVWGVPYPEMSIRLRVAVRRLRAARMAVVSRAD